MKERVQNAIIGLQKTGETLANRGSYVCQKLFTSDDMKNFYTEHGNFDDVDELEVALNRVLIMNGDVVNILESNGILSYSVPLQLIILWDKNWNERFAYYHPCGDKIGCDQINKTKVFVDFENEDFHFAQKDKIPTYFRKTVPEMKPTACDSEACHGIAAEIPFEDGGPMFYYLASASRFGSTIAGGGLYGGGGGKNPMSGWHYVIAFNMRLLQQIQANRTGLCVAGYSSEEDLPSYVREEIQYKIDHDMILNPHDFYPGNTRSIKQKTDQVTKEQNYYAHIKGRIDETDRSYCDPSYDHSGDIATSYAYFAYWGYDLTAGNLSDKTMYLVRFDFDAPMTAKMMPPIIIFIVCLIVLWLLCITGMIIFFDQLFLAPLDNMRKVRSDFIKTILKGLDDDGEIAQQVFGDMLDDSALIEANGDEISVMLTLQDRVDALYTKIIDDRQSDLNRLRNHALRDYNALRLMSFFLRRDDDNLRSVLPGLLDSNEMARRFRRTNPDVVDSDGSQDIIGARHAFRSLKSILSNNIATEFFKTYCMQRGRSSLNSFFFLMDVSWLSQAEGSVRSESEDFLSTLFAESIPQSPAISPISSPRAHMVSDSNLGMNLSSDLLVESSMTDVSASGADRPRRSHFNKSKESVGNEDSNRKKIPTVGAGGGQDSRNTSTDSLASAQPSLPSSPKPRVQFLSKKGEAIAQFIHQRYFGRKSLAQSDLKHAALLGCSQIPDYLTLRDKSSITFSPTMYNNLVTAITKKFSSDLIPQFLNSPTFQMMSFCLKLSGYFEKSEKNENHKYSLLVQEPQQNLVKETVSGVGFEKPLIHGVWAACQGAKKKEANAHSEDDDDDDESSSSSDDESDNSDDSDDKKKKSEDNSDHEEDGDHEGSDDE